MRLKIGDNVKVISGNDKGKFGKITNLMKPFVTVEGINIRTKHVKPATKGKIRRNCSTRSTNKYFKCYGV